MNTTHLPKIGDRMRRKADGCIGHVDFIARDGVRSRQPQHAHMSPGDVAIKLINDPTDRPVIAKVGEAGGVWEEWERVVDDVVVTVCAACRQATCWYALFFCSEADNADIVRVPRVMIMEERREHWSYLSDEGIERHTGLPPERAEPAELLAMMIRERMTKLGIDARSPGTKTPGNDGDFFTIGKVDGIDGPLLEIDSPSQCQSLTMEQGQKFLDKLSAVPDGNLLGTLTELLRGL